MLINPYIFIATGNPLWNSLYSAYKAESNANDELGVYNGTAKGGLTYGTGKDGNDFVFNGTTAYVNLPNNAFNFTSDFTISTWVNQSSVAGNRDILSTFTNFGGNYYGWELFSSSGVVNFWIYNGTVTPISLQVNSVTFSINTWYHVLVVRKGSTSTQIYIDGILRGSNTSTINPVYHTTNNANIGAYNNIGVYGNFFQGKIDETYIWNRELTSTDVTTLYNAGAGTYY
jgi:hypothetical protein